MMQLITTYIASNDFAISNFKQTVNVKQTHSYYKTTKNNREVVIWLAISIDQKTSVYIRRRGWGRVNIVDELILRTSAAQKNLCVKLQFMEKTFPYQLISTRKWRKNHPLPIHKIQ